MQSGSVGTVGTSRSDDAEDRVCDIATWGMCIWVADIVRTAMIVE